MFEIIDRGGCRHRFDDRYDWQFALQEGSIDLLDKSVVEVLEVDGEDGAVMTFVNIIAVGNVEENTSISMPEKEIERCPQCGYGVIDDE